MTSKGKSQTPLEASKVVFQETVPFLCRFALLSFQNSRSLDSLLLVLEHAQVLAQGLLTNCIILKATNESSSLLHNIVIPPFEPLAPGHFVTSLNNWKTTASVVLTSLTVLLFLRYMLLIYCLILARKKREGSRILVNIWRWIFACQGRVMYLFVASIWTSAAFAARGGTTGFTDVENLILGIFSTVVVVTEFIFSLILSVYFECIIPRKSIFAAKSTKVAVMTLIQKFVTQMILVIFGNNPEACIWISATINLVLSIIRIYNYFVLLPPYKLQTLFVKGALLTVTFSLHVSCFMRCIVKSAESNEENTTFIIVTWIILSLLTTKLAMMYLNKIVLDCMTKYEKGTVESRINKLLIVRQVLKQNQVPTEQTIHSEQLFLFSTVVMKKFDKVFWDKKEATTAAESLTYNKEQQNQQFVMYLEEILAEFPKSEFAKLYAAYFYAKKAKLYGNSMRILNELRVSSSFKIKYNALLLINYIQTIVKTSYHNAESNTLDLSLYNYCLSKTSKLKLNMVKQAKLQIGICKQSLKATNLARILLDARKISIYRRKIQKLWNKIEEHLVEYYTQPLLLYAQYNLIMNNSLSKYLSYFKSFNSRSLKYNKAFSNDELAQENMFHETTGFMVISGLKKDMGIIKYCSKTIDKIYGEGIAGQNLVMILPGLMRPYYENFIQECLNSKDNAHFGKTEFKICVDKNQFLFQVSNHINISPFLTEGLNFYLLSRKSKETKDYILITNDGDIENYSRPIAEKLGLPLNNASNSKLRISQICPELEVVNNALNSVLNHKNNDLDSGKTGGSTPQTPKGLGNKSTRNLNNFLSRFRGFSNSFSSKNGLSMMKDKSKLEMARAKAIFHDYTEDGKEITFFPLAKGGVRSTRFQQGGLIYHCKISNFEVQEGRMLILEEIKSMDVDSDDISSRKKEVKFTEAEPSKENLEKRKESIGQFRATKTFFKKIESDESESESDSQFTTEEEKEGGWVNFDVLSSPAGGSERPLNLLGISEDGGLFASTERNLIGSPREALTIRHSIASKRRSNVLGIVLKEEEEEETGTITEDVVVVVKENESSVASKSKFDMQEKISKTFEQAVGTKYYSNIYKCLLALVYSVFLGMLVSLVVLSQTLNSDLDLLQGRKDLMINLEMENVLVIDAQRYIQILSGYISGEQDENDYNAEFKTPSLLSLLSSDISEMSEFNQNFLKDMETLDASNRERLFIKDVKIFYNSFGDSDETFTRFTIIEAIQKMLELESKAVGLAKVTLSDALTDFNLIMRNSLNDFLVKNQERIDAILNSSDSNKSKAFSQLDSNWIATLVGMTCLAVLYSGMIAKQYQREKQNLVAFTKLNPKRVKNLESKLTAFMTTIENEEELKPIQSVDESSYTKDGNLRIESLNSQNGKGEDRGLILKYALYIVHFMIALAVVMVFVSVSCIQARNAISDLNSKLYRLMFVERSMSRINLAMAVPIELLAGNDTTLVENKYPSVELANMIAELNTIQNSFLGYFDSSGSSDSAFVNEILFEDACAPLEKNTNQYQSCQQLKKGLDSGYSSGFLQFIDYLREVLKNVQSEYQGSDKGTSSLAELQKEYINDELAPFMVMRPINTMLVAELDWQFEKQIEKSQRQNNLLNALLYVFIVVICIGLYFSLLKKIGESDNEFKEVLRVFPSSLIFSNFILKSYLRKTSPGVLNHIINKI